MESGTKDNSGIFCGTGSRIGDYVDMREMVESICTFENIDSCMSADRSCSVCGNIACKKRLHFVASWKRR